MGIDVYIRWEGQTKKEEEAQYTGFDITKGHVGYLREAYHGGPYATKVLVPEGWTSDDGIAKVTAKELRKRLPAARKACRERHRIIYKEEGALVDEYVKSYDDFVGLFERLEKDGKNPVILVSA